MAKTVGNRVPAQGWKAAAELLRLVLRLRAGRPFIPKGVHRFRTFAEAQEWSLRMTARPG